MKQMSPSIPEHTWIFEQLPGSRPQHQSWQKDPRGTDRTRSFPPRSFQNDYLQKLNHRGYDPAEDPIFCIDDITIVDSEKDEVSMGFCGAIQNPALVGAITRFFRRVLCRESPSTQILISPGSAFSLADSFHEDSTLQWTNTTTMESYDRKRSDSCSTASSTLSELDEAREINRRWRRGF